MIHSRRRRNHFISPLFNQEVPIEIKKSLFTASKLLSFFFYCSHFACFFWCLLCLWISKLCIHSGYTAAICINCWETNQDFVPLRQHRHCAFPLSKLTICSIGQVRFVLAAFICSIKAEKQIQFPLVFYNHPCGRNWSALTCSHSSGNAPSARRICTKRPVSKKTKRPRLVFSGPSRTLRSFRGTGVKPSSFAS